MSIDDGHDSYGSTASGRIRSGAAVCTNSFRGEQRVSRRRLALVATGRHRTRRGRRDQVGRFTIVRFNRLETHLAVSICFGRRLRTKQPGHLNYLLPYLAKHWE